VSPKIVFEHPGQDTIPTSMYLCDNAGMVVICGGTSGYHADVDLRYLWMRQKRLQGSHGANAAQFRSVVRLVESGKLDPCLSQVLPLHEVGHAHQLLHEGRQPRGTCACR
jgi:crotonyl-CoA carboxylase/reductase